MTTTTKTMVMMMMMMTTMIDLIVIVNDTERRLAKLGSLVWGRNCCVIEQNGSFHLLE